MTWRVTPSRLDGLTAAGGVDRWNPFHYNGVSPSFFRPIDCGSLAKAEYVKAQIEARNGPGVTRVWAAYILKIGDEDD